MGYTFTRKTDNVDDVMAADINELQAAIEAPKYLQESGGPTVLEIGAVADGEFLKRSGMNVVGGVAGVDGYVFRQRLIITSTQNFIKANYPWLSMIHIKMVGGGGGGGGAGATTSSQAAVGGSGGGGEYAESIITNIAGLLATEICTVGAGGAGGAAGANNGGVGGNSSFGIHVIANGGAGGLGVAGAAYGHAPGGLGGTGGTGDLTIEGGDGGVSSSYFAGEFYNGGWGGGSMFGGIRRNTSQNNNGFNGKNYGGGGTGAFNWASQPARPGGAGAAGLIVLDLYE